MMPHKLQEPLPPTKYCLLQLAAPHTLLVTLNRPDVRNALHLPAHYELAAVFDYVEREPEIWCTVLTAAGERSFCSGADLRSTETGEEATAAATPDGIAVAVDIRTYPPSGFGGLATRFGARKPVIAAVQGYAFGGGLELVLACDVVVATDRATFALPEVKRGVIAASGGITRLIRVAGYHRAMSILLSGRVVSAREAKECGFVNEVVPSKKEAVKTALAYARLITSAAPDAVALTKLAAYWAEQLPIADAYQKLVDSAEMNTLLNSENSREGIAAFRERRQPQWRNSKL